MGEVILVCGRLCCGKTTWARGQKAVLLSVDELMLAMLGQDAGEAHDKYAARAQKYLFALSLRLAEAGEDVVLDWGFWTRASRREARAFYRAHGVPCRLVYLDVTPELWRERIEARNRALRAGAADAYPVDEGLLRKFEALFEEPEEEEIDLHLTQ